MALAERRKGATGEREVVDILKAAGWPYARRTHDGREQALRGDIALGPEGVHLECKRTEKASVWAWWGQASSDAGVAAIPVVAFRRSRSPWLALIELDELLPLLALRERA
jgi:Holliday junction resolvase